MTGRLLSLFDRPTYLVGWGLAALIAAALPAEAGSDEASDADVPAGGDAPIAVGPTPAEGTEGPGERGRGPGYIERNLEADHFHFTCIRAWYFRDFLPEGDRTDVLGFEFNSTWGWGDFEVANISYIELADYPRPVPGRPVGTPADPSNFEAATGFSDLLTAFLFSRKREHHGPHHFAYGFSAQLPTATDDTLGSGKWSIGPAIEYAYDKGRWFAAFVALQLWSVGGDSDRKDVNMLMIKPMVTYDLAERWKLVYMPYGISQYWDKPAGQQLYVPVGGGVQYGFHAGSLEMAASVQFFNYAVRPDNGSENDLRFMLEFDF